MRFMPDSAVLGTIGHAKRRAAKRKARARRNAARGPQPQAVHYMLAIVVIIVGIGAYALFA